jgi:hypothetical protein
MIKNPAGQFLKILLCRKPVFEDMIPPLALSLPPLGAGANVMPRYYLYKDLSAFF